MRDTLRKHPSTTAHRLLCGIAIVFFACVGVVSQAAEGADDWYAGPITSLSAVASQVGKSPNPNSGFFHSPCVLTELRRILGSDFQPYRRHLMLAGAGTFQKDGDYVCGDVSQEQVGGYQSLLYVDPKHERMYLFWLKGPIAEGDYHIYGDRPLPPSILASIARRLNGSWGHVATFTFVGDHLMIQPKHPAPHE